jgi:hypothetical protein
LFKTTFLWPQAYLGVKSTGLSGGDMDRLVAYTRYCFEQNIGNKSFFLPGLCQTGLVLLSYKPKIFGSVDEHSFHGSYRDVDRPAFKHGLVIIHGIKQVTANAYNYLNVSYCEAGDKDSCGDTKWKMTLTV